MNDMTDLNELKEELKAHNKEMYTTQHEVNEIKRELEALRIDINSLRIEIAGLLNAWTTANGVISFMKWLAASALIFFALWDYIKAFFLRI